MKENVIFGWKKSKQNPSKKKNIQNYLCVIRISMNINSLKSPLLGKLVELFFQFSEYLNLVVHIKEKQNFENESVLSSIECHWWQKCV